MSLVTSYPIRALHRQVTDRLKLIPTFSEFFSLKLPSFSADSSIFRLREIKNSHDNSFIRKTIQPQPNKIHGNQLIAYLVAIVVEYVRNIPPSSYKILGIRV